MAVAQSLFIALGAGLGETSSEWRKLNNEWNIGLDCIITECKMKCAHWQKLPFLLCGLAIRDVECAKGIARKAIALFDDKSNIDAMATYGRRHPLTARFLKKDFAGPDALRPLLEQFVQGADLSTDESLGPLRAWIGALRLIRVVERETEESCHVLSEEVYITACFKLYFGVPILYFVAIGHRIFFTRLQLLDSDF